MIKSFFTEYGTCFSHYIRGSTIIYYAVFVFVGLRTLTEIPAFAGMTGVFFNCRGIFENVANYSEGINKLHNQL